MRISGLIRTVCTCFVAVVCVRAYACTTAIVSAGASRTGRPLLWKQRDAADTYNVLAHVSSEFHSYTAVFNSDDTLRLSAYAGVNDAGFAIANNLSYNIRPDSLGLHTCAGRVMSLALASCKSVDDFERMLSEGEWEIAANFAVMDAHGGAAYFEAWDGGYTRYDVPEGGYLYRTNFSLSGQDGKGQGYARYATIGALMTRQAESGFSPAWLLDKAGRSFYNALTGKEASGDMVYDLDYIPRTTTISSLVIEGVGDGDRANSSVIWTAIGYTPCCYAVPVWLAAGDEIPSQLTASGNGIAGANALADSLLHIVHPYWDKFNGGEMYLDMRLLRKEILPAVRRYEMEEFRHGCSLDKIFRSYGIDIDSVRKYNAESFERFHRFDLQMRKLL